MIDIKIIRKDPEKIKNLIKLKKDKIDIDKILNLDKKKREKLVEVENLRHERKKYNDQIASKKKKGEDPKDLIKDISKISEKIKELDNEISKINEDLNSLLLWIPNLPAEDVPKGGEENNKIVKEWGEVKKYDFEPKPHWELGEKLDILDIIRAAKISGSGFTMFKGLGAKLERALLNFMLDTHTNYGYIEMAPPYLVNRKTLTGTGQLPKLEDDMYYINKDDLFLIPTSEVSLVNVFQDEIIDGEKLPIYLMSSTPCFRREAGAHGKDTRGLLRVHQFNKVELIHFVKEEDSYKSLELLLSHAESILQKLGLRYRVVLLATEEISFSSAKTYDIEVWAPGVKKWLEVSSCSNCTDFQARRANIKYKFKKQKAKFVHTLNGSGIAIPRLMVSLMETYQTPEGYIKVPDILVPYLNGIKVIK